jgi:hypothetical protein
MLPKGSTMMNRAIMALANSEMKSNLTFPRRNHSLDDDSIKT